MAASASVTCSQCSDSSGEEYVPNSQSETEEEVYPTSPELRNTSKKAPRNMDKTDGGSHGGNKTKSAAVSSHKRTGNHLCIKSKMPKRAKMQRNKSHASKITCCDMEEIETFLSSGKKCCAKKCLMKIKEFKDDAVATLAELRHQRFAGPLNELHENFHHVVYHPGVKINS